MRRLALLLAGLTAGAWLGYRWGWLDGADYVEAWAATEDESIADICALLGCTPDALGGLIAEACRRIDSKEADA